MSVCAYTLIELEAIIGNELTNHPNFCDSRNYWSWEEYVAIPALRGFGYKILDNHFRTLEGDSCGPLTRGIRVQSSTGLVRMAWYG